MSREIKFRAWDASKGRFVIESAHVHVALTGNASHCSDSGISNRNDLALQQYTGLKDKNGMEIYEGDIVQFFRIDEYTHCHEPRHVARIYWANGGFQFTDKHTPNRTLASLWRPGESMEVIGNIYENPDLLKAADV